MGNNPRYTYKGIPLPPNQIVCIKCSAIFWTTGYWIEVVDHGDSDKRHALGRQISCPKCRADQKTPIIYKDADAVKREYRALETLGIGRPTLIPLDPPQDEDGIEIDIDLSDSQ